MIRIKSEYYDGREGFDKVTRRDVTVSEICGACRGSGSIRWLPDSDEIETVPCRQCSGSGETVEIATAYQVSQKITRTCSDCAGTGSKINLNINAKRQFNRR